MKFKGKVWRFGDDVDTDVIMPARYLNTSEPSELAKHCMEDIDKGFVKKIGKGDIIAAGKNFGCGSSREHAPIAIKNAGISCVIAESFARIFFRNSINIGLPVFETKDAKKIRQGETIEIDADKGEIHARQTYAIKPLPDFIKNIIAKGGLMNYVKEKIK